MTHFVHPDLVLISDKRQRQEHDIEAHQELVESIRTVGLMHPIVIRRDDKGQRWLVAGERRLRAVKDILELGGAFKFEGELCNTVPYNDIGELSSLEAEEAELDENIKRKDLTWQERAEATQRLNDLRSKQVVAGKLPQYTRADLVEELRGKTNNNDMTTVAADLIVARQLHRPEVAAAKTVKEALKVIKNIERTERNLELAEKIGSTISAASHTLLNGDFRDVLAGSDTGRFDVILTDPPYGMGADEFGDSGGMAAGAHGYTDSFAYFCEIMDEFVPMSYLLAKPNAHLYCFCDVDNFLSLKTMFTGVGWRVFRTPLIWYKKNGQRAPWPQQGPQRKYETILFAVKGDMPVTKIYGDVLEYMSDENLGHSAQKPVALYQDLLNRSVTPGMRVLDTFCGTGPVIPAAHNLKCYATAVEKDPASYAIAYQRLKGLA